MSVNRNGALCLDYSVVIPVLVSVVAETFRHAPHDGVLTHSHTMLQVNSLSELNAFFAETKSRLRSLIGNCTDQLFSAQTVVAEIGSEIAAMHEGE